MGKSFNIDYENVKTHEEYNIIRQIEVYEYRIKRYMGLRRDAKSIGDRVLEGLIETRIQDTTELLEGLQSKLDFVTRKNRLGLILVTGDKKDNFNTMFNDTFKY